MKLTIGMPCYDDYQGVWFTIQSLRLYAAPEILRQCELLVVDTHPSSEEGARVREFLASWVKGTFAFEEGKEAVRYVSAPEAKGTAAAKDRVFREAQGEIVLCVDCHVMLAPGGLEALLAYFAARPGSRDLVCGPMIFDDLRNLATHLSDDFGDDGVWGQWRYDERGDVHLGATEPFEIDHMGTGLMACRREAWPGFPATFAGFGGEEKYIHDKARKLGGRCVSLPRLRWLHRFGGTTRYVVNEYSKARNYVLGGRDLDWPAEKMRKIEAHFLGKGKVTPAEWALLQSQPIPPSAAESCGGCGAAIPETLEQAFQRAAETPSDINEHCDALRRLASQCERVTEFGMRHGVSTVALLAGQPKRLTSYDRVRYPEVEGLQKIQEQTAFKFQQGDSLSVAIEPTDLLFIDTKHTADQLAGELTRHADQVSRWIVLHDTEIFGETGEDGGPGLLPAMRRFLKERPEWFVHEHHRHNHGLTVLSRDPRDKKKLPSVWTMGVNFAKAVQAHVADGLKTVEPAELESRLSVCSLCEFRRDDRCSLCGCFLAEKASWRSSECPLGKWSNPDHVPLEPESGLPLPDVQTAATP